MTTALHVNGRDYPRPAAPIVVICLDGCEPAYFDAALDAGKMPALARIVDAGTSALAHCVIPSFTNPNNMSIATGRLPEVHGICGNFLYDPDSGEEVMMNDPRFLRAGTIFKAYYDAGLRVAVVTAKDKLRALLGHGLRFDDGRAVCFSSEKSAATRVAEHGIDDAAGWLGRPVPDVYSAELSEFVFAAGCKLLDEFKPDIMYLTTTDYVQHKSAPGEPAANAFYEMFDRYLDRLDRAGAVIAITADHGMSAKHDADGKPDVIYLQDLLDDWLGAGAARVILPITDPYVVHHGALGSFATAYLPRLGDADRAGLIERLRGVDGLELVVDNAEACRRFGLPGDRIGDIVLISTAHKTLGTSVERHDLSGLEVPLRSHGGLSEQVVPLVFNRALADLPALPELRNFDALYYAARAAGSEQRG